ncbi:MAG: alpha/beta fold hydrolase [Anaeromyxobacter sp.]|nr:alpha/beta fold hydrolase [Anaeromyxobacter sp.]
MTDPFRPAALLGHPDAQTIFANLWRPRPGPPMERQRWELPDGDFLDLRRATGLPPEAPVVVVCHGLEGSSRAPYVRGLCRALALRGLASLALDFRTCGGELNRLPRTYHSGETGDLSLVVERLAAERPGRPVLVAGFSLGGNVVVKYLGERGDRLPAEVRGGVAISVPFDLAASSRRLDGPGRLMWLYRERFLRRLRRKAAGKAASHPGTFDAAAVARATTFAEFDELMTAPLHGFASRHDYYARCSSGRFLAGVRRPLLALAAADDPMVPGETLPLAAARATPAVTLTVTAHGGHTAFVDGWWLRPGFWAERTAADYLAALVR